MTSPAALISAAEHAWPDLDYRDLAVPGQGTDHHVVVTGDHVLRAPATDAHHAQAPAEAAVLAALAPLTEVRLPVVLRHASDWSLTLQPFFPGRPLDADHWNRLPRARRGRVTDQLASLLTALLTALPHCDTTAAPCRDVEPWFRGATPNPAPRTLPAKVGLLRRRVAERELPCADRRTVAAAAHALFDAARNPIRPGAR